MILKFTLSRPSLLSCQANVRVDPPVFHIILIDICVLIFCMCSFWINGCFLIHRTNRNFFFLYPVTLGAFFQRQPSFLCLYQ